MRIPFRKAGITLAFISFAIIVAGCAEDKVITKKQSLAKQNLGKSFLAQGNFTAGLNELLKAEELDPENPEIQNDLALAYMIMDMHSKSITHFKRAIKLRPNFSEAYNNLGNTYLILSKWDLAIKCFEKALGNTLYATPHFAYNNLGYAYYKKVILTRQSKTTERPYNINPLSAGPFIILELLMKLSMSGTRL